MRDFTIEKESTCNGCANLDFKYKQCRALKEKHRLYDKNGKEVCTYDVFRNLNCLTVPSMKNDGEFITVLKDKNCKGYVPRKNKKVKNGENKKGGCVVE